MGAFTRNIRNLWRLSKREVLCQLDVCKPDTISRFVNLRNSLWNSSFIQNTDDACSLHLTDVLRVCCYAKWAASRLWTINKLFASWESLHLIIMLAVVRGNSWLWALWLLDFRIRFHVLVQMLTLKINYWHNLHIPRIDSMQMFSMYLINNDVYFCQI